jgi:hypothetical protein
VEGGDRVGGAAGAGATGGRLEARAGEALASEGRGGDVPGGALRAAGEGVELVEARAEQSAERQRQARADVGRRAGRGGVAVSAAKL